MTVGEVVVGHSFASEGETMTVGAGVWLGHRQIDATISGRPGSGCRPLRALRLAQKHSVADLPASELSVGRRKPEPTPGTSVSLVGCPSNVPSVMFPRFGPNGGLAM